jgi:hypothetical protein
MMASPAESVDNGLPEVNEKVPEKVDIHTKLAEEVYGHGVVTGEVDKVSYWGLKARGWIARLGGEEGGIERVPPELRTNQHPRDLWCLFSSGNACVTTLGTFATILSY